MSKKKITWKWHHFVQWLILPISILAIAYLLMSIFFEVFGFKIPGLYQCIQPLLEQFHIKDVFHLGKLFWTVIAKMTYFISLFVLAILAWLRMIKYKPSAILYWLTFLLLSFLGLLFEYLHFEKPMNLIFSAFANFDLANLQNILTTSLDIPSTFSLAIIRAISWLILFIGITYFVLNIRYYYRRKPFFTNGKTNLVETKDNKKEDVWVCTRCNTKNVGRLCTKCGTPKSIDQTLMSNLKEDETSISFEQNSIEQQLQESIEETSSLLNSFNQGDGKMENNEIELVLPNNPKEDKISSNIELTIDDTKKDKEEKTIVLKETPSIEKKVNEDIQMTVDTNPFAVKVDKNISLNLNNNNNYCTNCGFKLSLDDIYCPNCGKKVR